MTALGAWLCQWPDCSLHAATQVHTVDLHDWMKLCPQHRKLWASLPAGDIRAAYHARQPARRGDAAGSWGRPTPTVSTAPDYRPVRGRYRFQDPGWRQL
jgi:hypothetical protein